MRLFWTFLPTHGVAAGSSNDAKKGTRPAFLGGVKSPKQDTFFSSPMNPSFAHVYEACRTRDVETLQRVFPDGPTEWRSSGGSSLIQWMLVC
jgi:hypothetical protein